MRIHDLTEATRPYVEKVVDPALMTYWEYVKIVNPKDKMHPSDSYQSTVEKMNSYDNADNYPKLINNITVNGVQFEIREQKEDRWEKNYVKTDQDHNVLRDPSGNILYLSKDEISSLIPTERRFNYEYAVIRKDTKEIVGTTSDEWGALLVMVASEYRNFGFGTMLVKLKRTKNPEKTSGGFTNAGLKNFKRVHSQMVRDYMESGMYSYLVKSGIISSERAKEIIDSIGPRKDKKPQMNLNTTDPKDWVIMTDNGGSYAIVYDKKIYELDKDYVDYEDYWVDKFIIAMVGIGGFEKFSYIDRKYGPDKIISKLIEILINGEYPSPMYLEEEEYKNLKNIIGSSLKTKPMKVESRTMYKCWIDSPTVDVSAIVKQETDIRKKHDEYDEYKVRIQELAESLAS